MQLDHDLNRPTGLSSGSGLAIIVAVKLALVATVFLFLYLGADYLGAGLGVLAAHLIVLGVAALILLRGGLGHSALFGGARHRAGDHSKGILLHDAARYDMLARVLTFGREGRFRELMLRPMKLKLGEDMLDVACGTGTLAIAAAKIIGPDGSVIGVDASQEMVDRAQGNARDAGLAVTFFQATAQGLPFEACRFDVVSGTLMLNHLSKPARAAFAREALRVLRPGGRLVLVDFGKPAQRSKLPRIHRHGHVDMSAVAQVLQEHGFDVIETGEVGTKNLKFVIARSARER